MSRLARVGIGLVLLGLTALPLHRLLDPRESGLAATATVELLDIYHEFVWTGLLLLLPVAIVGARLLPPARLERFGAALRGWLLAPSTSGFVTGAAFIGALLGTVFCLGVLQGTGNNIDAFAQLLQARYWSAGLLAGPSHDLGGFWTIQNALFTPAGWVSQYPPGHVALLVPFFRIGAPWLIGPVLIFTTIVGTGLFAHRLFVRDPVVARIGTALLAVSPFFLFVSVSLMNHITAVACTSLGAFFLLRAWQDRLAWALPAGLLFALALATRPLSTLLMGAALALTIPFVFPGTLRRAAQGAALAILGATPIVAAWLLYNHHFFGAALRSGYSVTLGPAMRLGLHRDPWGNRYGPIEAIAYTSSDLTALAVNLFETPLPALFVIAVFLLVTRRLPRAAWLLLAWAIAPVLGNAFYWHHGLYFGPRMLHEASPAWVLLFSLALVGLLRRIPPDAAIAGRYFLRPGFAVAVGSAFLVGFAYLIPERALSYGGQWLSIARTPLPPVDGRALVFVHDAWNARIAMTLAGTGMRLDIVETLLRQNSTCRVHEVAAARAAGDPARAARLLAALDTVPRASNLPPEVRVVLGEDIRMLPGEVLTPECRQQALSDRHGILDLAPLLWRAGLHGQPPGKHPLIVRDHGPDRNRQMLQAYPDRTPYVYAMTTPDGAPRLMPYDAAMDWLWNAASDGVPLGPRRNDLLR